MTLGNDPELDPNREPEPPTKAVDKPIARSGKRNAAGEAPERIPQAPLAGGRGGRNNATGSEQAYRDKGNGALNNRSREPDDGLRQDRHPDRTRAPNEHRDVGGRGGRSSRGGGGYGARGMRGTRTARDDRHSRTGIAEHEKQAAKGWGPETGEGEFDTEKEGLADARAEERDGIIADDTPVDENGVSADQLPAEPEDKTKSYEQYLAEQLEKKAALNDRPLETRKANEGASKKFPEGKAFTREYEDFVSGAAKAARQRERKSNKQTLDIDQAWVEQQDTGRGERGPRGGGRGRGEGRGGRGRGEGRGRGDRGVPRGDRVARAAGRGGAGGPNITDDSAFPSLGGK
ncbi:hypothetical protein MBLNU457_3433t2 [Dothideomycetes sp. NU457]